MLVSTEKGFTITELIIAASVGGMLAVVLFTITIFMYGGVVQNDTNARLILESQNILRRVVEDLRVSSAVRVTNTIPDANEPIGGWTTSNSDLILIIATPALDINNNYIIDDVTGLPFQNEIIYYADGTNLYKRILAEPSALGNTFETSCPPSIATPTCQSDRNLTANFSDMDFIFYDQDDIETSDPTVARSVGVNIEMDRNVFGRDVTAENNIRVTLRNAL